MKNLLLVALLPAGLFADEVNVSNFGTSNYADTDTTWGQAPKSVLKNHHYADILCGYR